MWYAIINTNSTIRNWHQTSSLALYVPCFSGKHSYVVSATIKTPSEIVACHFSSVVGIDQGTLIQYATVAGHFPGVSASSVKPKPKKANKFEVTSDEPKGDVQVNATTPTTPRPKPKAQAKASPQATPPRVENKPPEARREGKGSGKGKRGKSEPRVEKRKQQCIHFFRGTCQRGDKCRYEHQVGDDGRPVPVGPEILQRFDDAVKRYNETRAQAQAKPKAAPRGGVTASMIVLEPDDLQHGIVVNAAEGLDDDECYAVVDSGTNAIIVPLHPKNGGRSCGMPGTRCHSHRSHCPSL